MRQKTSLLVVLSVLVLFNLSWAQCPEEPADLGECDTFHVAPWPITDTCFVDCSMGSCDTICINNPGEYFPCFLHVPLLVTHDSNTFYSEPWGRWLQDSIALFDVPLTWTRTNPTAYCSVSVYWNESAMCPSDPAFSRSVFRHFQPSVLDSNRLAWLCGQSPDFEWLAILNMASDSVLYEPYGYVPPHFWMALICEQPPSPRWWEGERTLLATITFRIADTMHICIDSTFWPPSTRLRFVRYDAATYFPRNDLPLCIWVGPPPLVVTSPNGGENWCIGETREITWSSVDFSGPLVMIEYSADAGATWWPVEDSTQNDGTYAWTVPDTPSGNCLVRVSDAEDGSPYDESDGFCTLFSAGDANRDGMVDIGDVVCLINCLFTGGPALIGFGAGDMNSDGIVNVGDVVYLINYLFLNGPAPSC